MGDMSKYTDEALELALTYGPGLAIALATLLIGLLIIGLLTRSLEKTLSLKKFDPSLKGFFVSLSNIGLKVLLVISVAGMVGIEMTSFIAVLGAAGLAIGMALSGTLQNFAAGVMILVFRPYKAGDFVEAQGYSGTVAEIQIFNTILTTPDNKTVIMPNAKIGSDSIVNYSAQSTRRVDQTFGIGYDDDFDLAKSIIHSIVAGDDRVHLDPEPFVSVSALADSSVNIVSRVWVDSSNYWPVYFETLEAVKKEFDAQGISIPYPQQDVHMYAPGESNSRRVVNG